MELIGAAIRITLLYYIAADVYLVDLAVLDTTLGDRLIPANSELPYSIIR